MDKYSSEQAELGHVFHSYLSSNCSSESLHCLSFTMKSQLPSMEKANFIWFDESPLRMMKNVFSFIIKALLILKLFKFSSCIVWSCRKWLEKKAKANFKIHDVINCETNKYKIHIHCVQSIRIRSYSGPHFPAFELNTDSYSVSLCIQSEFGKMRTRITPSTGTFHAVISQFITK